MTGPHSPDIMDRGKLLRGLAANKSTVARVLTAHTCFEFGSTMFAISSHSLAILRNSFLSTGEELLAADRRALAASPRKRFIRCSGVSDSSDTRQTLDCACVVNNGIAGAWFLRGNRTYFTLQRDRNRPHLTKGDCGARSWPA